jgi:hypothetical protein
MTSSKERQIEDYSIGLAIPGRLSCPNKKKEPKDVGTSNVRPGTFYLDKFSNSDL